MRTLHDHWTQRAKQEGYPARSVYKLKEIEEKFHILRGVQTVLDVGASPGSWTLYLLRTLSSSAKIVSVDLNPLRIGTFPNLTFVSGDIADPQIIDTLADLGPYDLILSDAAPNTTGIRTVDTARSEALAESVAQIIKPLLTPGGSCVLKIFQGAEFVKILKNMEKLYSQVRTFKPKASRSESFEVFLIGLGKRRGFN